MIKNKFIHWNEYRKTIGLNTIQGIYIIILSFISTLSEAFGIAIFIPIFQFAEAGENYEVLSSKSKIWDYLFSISDSIGLSITLPILLIVSFLFFFSRQVFLYVRSVYITNLQRTLDMNLKNKLFNIYMQSSSTFHDKYPVGSFTNLVTQESQSAVGGILIPLDMITNIVMLFVYILILFYVNFALTLTAIVVFILVGTMLKTWVNRSKKAGKKVVQANTKLTSFLVERIKSPRLVRLSHTEKTELNYFENLTNSQKTHMLHSAILRFRTQSILEPFFVAISLIFIYFSVNFFNLGIGIIGVYLLISFRLLPVVNAFILLIQKFKNKSGSVDIVMSRINEMALEKEVDNGRLELNSVISSLEFDSVSYKYPLRDSLALNKVSFDIVINKMTAIVGPSGGGKSTLVDLIPRLRAPTKGIIKINENNIEKYSLSSLRESISYATQNRQIFSGTIRDHIMYSNQDATDKDIRDAVVLSGSNEFIKDLPKGLDTDIGGESVKLSGGQIQRLDLARVLIRKSPILILDEPTSNLDSESEDIFNQVLRNIRRKGNTTIITVSHKLSNIIDADQIIVLKDGKIDDIGVHSQLISKDGWYSMAWDIQN